MITKTVQVTQTVTVTIDETKFDEEFMEEFRASFYNFDSLDDHIKHLVGLEATGYVSHGSAFIEGYGPMHEMGIKLESLNMEAEIVES